MSGKSSPQTLSLLACFALALISVPLTFMGLITGWQWRDHAVASQEVAAFMARHKEIVLKRQLDPRVHAFSLSQDPENSATLLIQVDVDDKETFEMVEEDISDIASMTFTPKWTLRIRSGEKPHNLGYMATGVGLVAEAIRRLIVAAVVSAAVFGLVLWLSFWLRIRAIHSTPSDGVFPGVDA